MRASARSRGAPVLGRRTVLGKRTALVQQRISWRDSWREWHRLYLLCRRESRGRPRDSARARHQDSTRARHRDPLHVRHWKPRTARPRVPIQACEQGAGTVLAIGVIALVLVLTGAVLTAVTVVIARMEARATADVIAVQTAERVINQGWSLAEACTKSERSAQRSGAVVEECSEAEEIFSIRVRTRARAVPVAVRVTSRAGPIDRGHGTGGADASSSSAQLKALSTSTAPSFHSGSLLLPHFGDWTQRGHPLWHGQPATASRVARIHSRPARYPRSAQPEPPAAASWIITVAAPVSRWYAVDKPPTSHRSQIAKRGSIPMAACSAACRAPGTFAAGMPSSSKSCDDIVHQVPHVSMLRSRGVMG